jgi:hypothetical protein
MGGTEFKISDAGDAHAIFVKSIAGKAPVGNAYQTKPSVETLHGPPLMSSTVESATVETPLGNETPFGTGEVALPAHPATASNVASSANARAVFKRAAAGCYVADGAGDAEPFACLWRWCLPLGAIDDIVSGAGLAAIASGAGLAAIDADFERLPDFDDPATWKPALSASALQAYCPCLVFPKYESPCA